MTKSFRDAQIFYRFFDRKTDVVNVFLHGWGCDHNSFLFCCKEGKQSALLIDFPPFGKSSKDIKNWTVFTYANMVTSLCESLGIKKFNLVGHSFGGRVAIILAAICKEKTNKLVLVDSAGLKPRRKLSYFWRVYAFKIRRALNMDVSGYGSEDFRALSPEMKKIFTSVVNTHLDAFLSLIVAPTLIVFGQNDDVTPLYLAKRFHRKIKNSNLVIMQNAGHFCFQEKKVEFLRILRQFLSEKTLS